MALKNVNSIVLLRFSTEGESVFFVTQSSTKVNDHVIGIKVTTVTESSN